jgi:uncharacterized pyridoxamine 5'-phosphate oxidase family protein
MQRILEFLEQAGYYFLATVEGDSPRIRPFGSYLIYDRHLYVCMGDFKDVYRQLMANPKIAIGAIGNDGEWMRITGELVFDDRTEPQQAMYEALPSLHELYDEKGRELKVAYIRSGHVQFYGNPGQSVEYDF